MIGLGDNLARRKLALRPPKRAENDDWCVGAAGDRAKIFGRDARRLIAVGIEDDQVGPEPSGQRDGLLRAIRFERGRSTTFQDRSQDVTGLGRLIHNQYAGHGRQAIVSVEGRIEKPGDEFPKQKSAEIIVAHDLCQNRIREIDAAPVSE